MALALALGLAGLLVGAAIRPGLVIRWLQGRYPDVLFRVESDAPLVGLTFDDGPHPALTPRLLDVLAEHDAHATFFVIGERVPSNEAILRRLVGEGHELANHLMLDEPSARLPAAEFARQLRQTHDLLAPFGPVRWFRPGHGWYTRRMLGQLRAEGYQCALASAYALEFHIPSTRYAAWHILRNAHPGAVIVLHDGAADRQRTVETLRRVLPALRQRGYRVVTLSELVAGREANGAAAIRAPG